MSVAKIKKGDIVVVKTGVSSGKTGKVLQVLPVRQRAIVEGLNLRKKAIRKSENNPQGGIVEKEGSIHISNLMLYNPNLKKGVKVRREREAEKSVRRCKISGHAFDS